MYQPEKVGGGGGGGGGGRMAAPPPSEAYAVHAYKHFEQTQKINQSYNIQRGHTEDLA